MANYTVELNYNARITLDVEANEEGEALGKARELAEEAPITSFNLTEENNARIVALNGSGR